MSKCPVCGKTVFFAERQTKEGKDYHGHCLQQYLKAKGDGAKTSSPFHSYTDAKRDAPPNVQKGGPGQTNITVGTGNFCSSCGCAKEADSKFCGGCGASLDT